MNMNSQQTLSTIDSAGRSSANQSQGNSAITTPPIDRKKFDVLKIYEDVDKVKNQSILTGGLDTGIDFGKFIIDTNIGTTSSATQEIVAERFIGPYARTQLNNLSWLNSPKNLNLEEEEEEVLQQSEQQSNYLMQQYFRLVNTHMHGLIGGKVESESFSHDFRLPKCYDIPKAKLRDITQS